MSRSVFLSVIIPAYNEEMRLPGTLRDVGRYLSCQPYESEVIVVDDGSTDHTARVARAGNEVRTLRILTHSDGANHGKGASVREGMLAARGAYRIFMDADNSTTIDQIAGFWPWFDQGYDIAIGSRRARGSRVEVHQARYKEMAGKLGNWVIRAFAVPGIEDTQAGFKMFTSRCAEEVFPLQTIDRWGCDIEILAIARLLGYRIREVPIVWVNSPGSKVRWHAYFQVLHEVWRIRRNTRAGIYSRLH